jgi:phage tail P2-like protein
VPVPLRDLWNPDTCPADCLPFLAWAFSVDRWKESWSESTKRSAIKAARYIHQHKGTIAAVRGVVESLGYLIRITEWWQTEPRGERGTFSLDVGVLDSGITDEMFVEMERLLDDAKPLSRHLTGLALILEIRAAHRVGVSAYLGDVLTIYPFSPGPISVSVRAASASAVHLIDVLTIHSLTNEIQG